MTPEDARALVSRFEQERPEAFRLARLISLAVRIEPELVREVRLKLLPGVDAGAEADLWFSPLVQSQTAQAMVFMPEVAEVLRQRLAEDQALLRSSWRAIKAFHKNSPQALCVEEEITWLALSSKNNSSRIEKRLLSVMASMGEHNRTGLARWATRALPTMPKVAKETEAARILSVVAGEETGEGPVLLEMPRTGGVRQWLSRVSSKNLTKVPIGVRLFKDRIVSTGTLENDAALGFPDFPEARQGLPFVVELSYPPDPDVSQIEVPLTIPVRLEVSWKGAAKPETVSLLANQTKGVKVDYGDVELRTALGDVHVVRLTYDYDFFLAYDQADQEWGLRLLDRLRKERWKDRSLRVIGSAVYRDKTNRWPNAEFSTSRKVGFVISPESIKDSWPVVQSTIPERPEPPNSLDWLITINLREATAPPFLSLSKQDVSFTHNLNFETGYRELISAITGEPIQVAEEVPVPPPTASTTEPVKVYCVYSRQDEGLLQELEKHLEVLKRRGVITLWDNRRIKTGEHWQSAINQQLREARIILLLVSAYFLASEYAFDVEMKEAMDRHASGEASVIPILLRPVDWEQAPFANLQVLPSDGRPVTSWENHDEAFVNITEGIRKAVDALSPARPSVDRQNVSRYIPRPPIVGFVPRRNSQGMDLVELLRTELAPNKYQIIALWGAGGIGKTTLAAEAARSLADVFGSRIVWASADGRTDFSFVTLLDEIVLQLERSDLRHLSPEEKQRAVSELILAESILIVLDSFETIVPDEQSKCIEFLDGRIKISALITTRLVIQSARSIQVSSMSPGEADEFLNRLISNSTNPQIFTADIRSRIAKTAEANPLAMQWVVAQIDLAQSPERVLNELASGRGDAASRLFDRPFDLPQLGDDGRDALLALSLFVPSASRTALAEVAGFGSHTSLDQATAKLAALQFMRADVGDRLVIEGLTRTLARARLAKDDHAADYRKRFVAYFLNYAQEHRQALPEDFDVLQTEKDNLLSAIDIASQNGDELSVVKIRTSLDKFLEVRGYWDEALRSGERAIVSARATSDDRAVAHLMSSVVRIRTLRGEYDEARQMLDEVLQIFRRHDDKDGEATSLHNLGLIARGQGNLQEARQLFQETLQIQKELGNRSGISGTLHQLGGLAQRTGEIEEARRLYQESLQLDRQLGNQVGVSATVRELGNLASYQGEIRDARGLYEESLAISQKLGDQSSIAATLYDLGSLAQDSGELPEARQLFEQSAEISTKLGNKIGEANALYGLGSVAHLENRFDEAETFLNRGLEIQRRLGNKLGTAGALYRLGLLFVDRGDNSAAASLLHESLGIFEALGSPEAESVRDSLKKIEGSFA